MVNDGKYGMEVQEYSMILNDPSRFEIEDRIWMQRRMSFDVLDLQKHQKRNHFSGGNYEQSQQCNSGRESDQRSRA